MDEISAIPRNRYIGLLADALRGAQEKTGIVGDFLFGEAPRVLDDMSYGFSPVRMGRTDQGLAGALYGMRVDPGVMDVAGVAGMAPAAARGGAFVGREALGQINDAMLGGGNQALARALSGVAPRNLIDPDDIGPLYHRSSSPQKPDIDPNKGRFDSIFTLPEPPPDHYGAYLHQYRAAAPIMENDDVFEFLSSDKGRSWLESRLGRRLSEEDVEDLAWALADESNALNLGAAPSGTPESTFLDLFGAFDESDLYAEFQRARANIARDRGLGGVVANDEFGTSYQLVKPDSQGLDIEGSLVQEIVKAAESIPKGQRVGLRMMPPDVPLPTEGSTLSPSFRWVDGVPTDRVLYGTSSVGLDRFDGDSVRQALRTLGQIDRSPLRGYYPGQKIGLIYGKSKRKGEDAGESMIKDATLMRLFDNLVD